MTIRSGGAYAQYINQKLNPKSSTKAKIFGVNDVLTQVICTQYLMKEKGCKIHNNIIYQDNQSSIRWENNFRKSISKRTRHINIRYYFITDRVAMQEAYLDFFLPWS